MRFPDRAGPSAVCLMGQTATGKTDIAVEMARRLPVEIISVDSAMVYRGMDIGTAKPDAAVLRVAPHRLINIRDPEESYSAGDFLADASAAIDEIQSAGMVPLLVGGTMLYFRALRWGLADLPARDTAIRAEIDARAAAVGWPALHAELGQVDPAAAARIEPTDAQRIQRALEVFRLSGRPISEWHATGPAREQPRHFLNLALVFEDRNVLRERIRRRLSAMMADGFLAEVRSLLARPGLEPDAPSMRAVGYRQLARHVLGRCSLEEALNAAEIATGRLAKRQHTWIRAEAGLRVLDPLDPGAVSLISRQVEEIVGRLARP